MTVKHGRMETRKYWDIPYYPETGKQNPPAEAVCGNIQELLVDAIRLRLRADVPVGTYLSGGLDSSGVTALVVKNFNNNVKTFGIQFEEADFDESSDQKKMVSFLDTDHRSIMMTNDKIRRKFYDTLIHCEKPLLRTAPIPLFFLSELVRDSGLKVVLTGEGSDEVFGGYNIFLEDKLRRFWARQPDSHFRYLLAGKLYPYIFKDSRMRSTLRYFFSRHLENTDDPLYSHIIRWDNTAKIKKYFSEDVVSAIAGYNCYDELRESLPENFSERDGFSKTQYLEMSLFMSNYLLSSQGDRVAMAHSVEIRLPYLDYRIIDFMAQIPAKLKISAMKEKYLLKKSFQGILPDSIIARKKHPYRAPIRQALLNEETVDVLSEKNGDDTGLFNTKKVQLLLKKIQTATSPSEIDNMALVGILSTHHICSQLFRSPDKKGKHQSIPSVYIDNRTT